ncbi:ATP-binding protein [Thermomonospora umbrina]|nr:ATP-binding protein [Thermomonospora umbrina]
MAGDVIVTASELATNALKHALRAGPQAPAVPPELWVWARATPTPQLVVSVFDGCRSSWPDTAPRDPLDEHGRGLGIVGALAASWGTHPTRSRSRTGGIPGKAVWSAFPLPGPWPDARMTAEPAHVARHLASTLAERGIRRVVPHLGTNIALVSVPIHPGKDITVWVEPGHISSPGQNAPRIRRPVIDLYDIAEDLIRRVEQEHGHA